MNLENKLITEPQLLHSPYLSEKTGLDISILDYSCTSTGTHKIIKAVESVKKAKDNGRGILLFINPVGDEEKDSNGSGIHALELASAVYYPKSQVVCVVNSEEPYIKPEPINENFPNKRKRIVWGVNLNEFLGKEQLEDYFKDVIAGRTEFDKNQVKEIRNILYKKSLDFSKCLDLTNLEDCSCYKYSNALVKKLGGFDYLVGSAGTGERAVGQISLRNNRSKHIIVIPNGHVLDPFHTYEESDSKRIQTKFRVKAHDELVNRGVDRGDVMFKSVGLFGGKQAKELFVDKTIQADNFNMKTSYDGAIGFTVLGKINDPNYEKYFTKDGLKVFNTHKASEENKFVYLYNTVIPFGSKVCIVNTGISNDLMLKKLIEEGVVE